MVSARKTLYVSGWEAQKIATSMENAIKKVNSPCVFATKASPTMDLTSAVGAATRLWPTLTSVTRRETGSYSKKITFVST